ncbi:MAG: hypothetical protein IJZ53_07635 [Tyzzerella sp.]|nr:hypothetical protein [Tyzzerella sp.]
MEKIYKRINWQNVPSTETPLSAENLNKMDKGIEDLDNRMINDIPVMDTQNNVVTFESADAVDTEEAPLAWSDVEVLKTGEKHSSIFAKISQMFKNIRYLYKTVAELNGKLPDYIVEQGTSGIWTYRKWNSGIVELFGYTTGNSTYYSTNSTWGYSHLAQINLPFTLTSCRYVNASVRFGSGTATVMRINESVTAPIIYFDANLDSDTYRINIEVKGAWK